MYYKIKSNYLLRGWQKLPYVLIEKHNNLAYFIPERFGRVIMLCNGTVADDSILFLPEYKTVAEELCKNGFVEKTEQPSPLEPEQNYRVYPSRYVRSAHWSVTGRCNYRCKHCYMSAPHAKYGELPLSDCLKIVDMLAECGIQQISLTGGEPLVRKDFMQIVDALLSHDIRITSIYSNGKLVTRQFLEQLLERDIRPELNMSFDGVGWHDWLRGVDGAEKMVKDAFLLCHEMGFPTAAELCLHRNNINTLRESILTLRDLHVPHLKVSPVVNVGEWCSMPKELALSDEEVYETYLNYLPHYVEDGQPLTLALGYLFASDAKGNYTIPGVHKIDDKSASTHCICGHARLNMYISADGHVMPCMPLSSNDAFMEQFPQLPKDDLKEALNQSFYMSCIDLRLTKFWEKNETCKQCEYRFECGSGCRGQAMSTNGNNYYGIDPAACLLFKNHYVERVSALMEQCGLKRL